MVNSAYRFAKQSRGNSFASAEINPTIYQTDNRQQKKFVENSYCSTTSNIAHMQQTPEISSVAPVKSSPSYMDVDACFTYPDYPIGSKITSHVMAENPFQERCSQTQDYTSQAPPIMERQYSINTVMEVIENHDINDTSSYQCPSQIQSPFFKPEPTPPICIQRQPNAQADPNHSSSPQLTYLAPPASDVREYSMCGSSVSSSPETTSFVGYSQNCFNAFGKNLPDSNDQPHSYGQSYNGEGFSLQYRNQEMTYMNDIHQNPFSPCQSDNSSPMFAPSSIGFKTAPTDQVFTFDEWPDQPKPSPSSVDLNSVDLQRRAEAYTPHSNNLPGTSGQTDAAAVFSHAPPGIPEYRFRAIQNRVKLEEVDSNSVFEDFRHESSLTEQERADRRRIRNNQACRASRERRKKRKKDQEALAEFLAEKNRKLKEQIKQLEEAVVNAHADVRRRMSQS